MKAQNNKSTKIKSKFYKTDKRSLLVGGIVVILIAITPILFYTYTSFPNSQVWETSYFRLETDFGDWVTFAWFASGKIVPLYLLLLWFFTCKHWWHWIILIPIAMYSFQVWGVFNESNGYDEIEIIFILPLMMVIIPFVYLIRAKLFNSVREDNLESFEEELSRKQTIIGQIRDLFR